MYNTVDTGSSIEIDVEDVDREALFGETLLALSDVLADAGGGTAVTHEVEVSASDLDGLLVAWINELIRLAAADGFVAERAYRDRLAATSVRARVAGERGIPAERIRDVSCRSVGIKRLDDGAWSVRVHLDSTGVGS
jgi:SHS2 domain-containing protein